MTTATAATPVARPPELAFDAGSAAQSQYLSFFLAGEEYGVNILRVKEIVELDVYTRVPAAPVGVRGVINLRGRVIPVVDLAVRFGLPESAITRRSCVVIAEVVLDGEPLVMGVLADAVSQVLEFRADQLEPPPPFGTKARAEFISAMGQAGKKFVIILDLERVLAPAAADAAQAAREAEEGAQPAPAEPDAAEPAEVPPADAG